jgi:hypothetical protein
MSDNDLMDLIDMESENTQLRAIVQRVHDEYGPEEFGEYWKCKSCLHWAWKRGQDSITHKHDCLWEASDKALAIK